MLNWGCWSYRAKLEAYAADPEMRMEAGLEGHLSGCERCRTALDEALLAATLLQRASRSSVRPSDALVVRVMASIREEIVRRGVPETIWRPLEHLASRFALGAAAALVLFSLYLSAVGPALRPVSSALRAEASAVMPEPPVPPANADEVMMSLVERAPQ